MNDVKFSSHWDKKLPFNQAVLFIILSICLISGLCFAGLIYYRYAQDKQRHDDSYQIVAVVQTSPDQEGLKTAYLTELLGLSVDRPRNLYDFSTDEATKKLLQLPVIKELNVRKIRPGTIHVDYTLRKPIAYVSDYTNTVVDAEGIIFPLKPFYTPKKLPEIHLGETQEFTHPLWGGTLIGAGKELAFEILSLSSQYCDEYSSLCRIDVSRAFTSSAGQREIVLVLEDRFSKVENSQTVLSVHPRILRLHQDNYRQQLGNYLGLRSYLREQEKLLPLTGKGTIRQAKAVIIDLRLSELAFFWSES